MTEFKNRSKPSQVLLQILFATEAHNVHVNYGTAIHLLFPMIKCILKSVVRRLKLSAKKTWGT